MGHHCVGTYNMNDYCAGSNSFSYISQPDMSAVDHLINAGILLLSSVNCDCLFCADLRSYNHTDFAKLAINVELTRRHNPVKVFEALVENWDAERIKLEFIDKFNISEY
jgi:hypothetical protein